MSRQSLSFAIAAAVLTAVAGCSSNHVPLSSRPGSSGDGEALARTVASRARCGSFEEFDASHRDRWSFTCQKSGDMFVITTAETDAAFASQLVELRSANRPGKAGPFSVVSQFQTPGSRTTAAALRAFPGELVGPATSGVAGAKP